MSFMNDRFEDGATVHIETTGPIIIVCLIVVGSMRMTEIFDNDGAADAQRADTYANALADAHGCAVVHV